MNLSSNPINQNRMQNGRNPRRPIPNRAPAQPAKPQVQQANTLSNYGTTTKIRNLYPGQLLKGEVSDLRNTEIVVTLENNTTVAATIQNGNWLSIGETAAFRVLTATQENILLEAITKSDLALANSTINKALEEANIPKTPKNKEIVMELMQNKMPINKQGIQHILQLSYQHKGISIPTLVFMDKLHMPITEKNATQFEQYQQHTHAVASRLEGISQSIYTVLEEKANAILQVANDASSGIFVSEEAAKSNLPFAETNETDPSTAQNSTAPTNFQENEVTPSQTNSILQTTVTAHGSASLQHVAAKLLGNVVDAASIQTISKTVLPDTLITLSEEEQSELQGIIENFEIPESYQAQLETGTVSLRDTMHILQKDYAKAYELDKNSILTENTNMDPNTDNATEAKATNDSIQNTSNRHMNHPFQQLWERFSQKKDNAMLRVRIFESPVVEKLTSAFSTLQKENHEIGGSLSSLERMSFYDSIEQLPIDAHVKEQFFSGEVHPLTLLRTIKNVLPFTEDIPAAQVISSPIFKKILGDAFLSAYTLTPTELSEDQAVLKYYNQLSQRLDHLEQLVLSSMEAQKEINQLLQVAQNQSLEQINQAKDQLDFMKVLNQFFSYVQLPLQINEKYTHGEIYVYTRKKQLEQEQNPIHVLFHLDMEQLGPLDIDLHLNGQALKATFSLEDETSAKLIEKNVSLLEDALLEKGFLCQTKVDTQIKQIDIGKDFIAPEQASTGIARYSFDLRA